jgi:hypothetical protein
MANQLYIQEGVVSTGKKKGILAQLFDMRKWVTNLLVEYGLMAADPCCNNGFVANSIETYITATGTGQSTGRALTAQYNVVTAATVSDYCVVLPSAKKNMFVSVTNTDTSGSPDSIRVYPPVGDTYYVTPSSPSGAPFTTVAYGKTVFFISDRDGNWLSIVTP